VPESQTLGWRLAQARREKAAREHRDVQQADVAKAVGASKASVSRWENDIDVPRERALTKLAAFLGVTPAYLRYGEQGGIPSSLTGKGRRSLPDPDAVTGRGRAEGE
jgi:transcriptional regulator with XRE-family HTH domain